MPPLLGLRFIRRSRGRIATISRSRAVVVDQKVPKRKKPHLAAVPLLLTLCQSASPTSPVPPILPTWRTLIQVYWKHSPLLPSERKAFTFPPAAEVTTPTTLPRTILTTVQRLPTTVPAPATTIIVTKATICHLVTEGPYSPGHLLRCPVWFGWHSRRTFRVVSYNLLRVPPV
uniref:Uncharacterized protein n=1 Tax=Cacopsylla melanoneura TaxID=428564 RepID=A0A8D8UGK0_9HEMI